MDYSKFFSKIAKRRKPNLIRVLTESFMKTPGAINFASGMPNSEVFPFKAISVTYNNGVVKHLTGSDLHDALQYGPTPGYPPLIKKWKQLQQKWHLPKYNTWEVQFTTGSQDGCSKLFETILDEGDSVMVQTPTYTGVIGSVASLNPDIITVGIDNDGILPQEISKACETRLQAGKSLPKILYVNPTGCNPTGIVFSEKRKKIIYELAKKYDFLILEDDAYYFLHFMDEQPTSFFSLDTDGRVLRIDSFSKIMSAGLRLGVVTGPKPILEKLGLSIANSTLHTSSLSQMVVYKLLDQWTEDELNAHITTVQNYYREKRDIMLAGVEKYFTGIAEWTEPKGGMFVWLKITAVNNVHDLALNKFLTHGVYALPGHAFDASVKDQNQYLRLCYSFATVQQIEKGLALMSKLIREEAAKVHEITNNV